MANYKLGPVIGKIGGADVEVIPVDIVAGEGVALNVPEDEKWLIVLIGALTVGSSYSASNHFYIGEGLESDSYGSSRMAEFAGIIQGPATTTAGLKGSSTGSFTGHVYTVPLPD